MTTPPPPATRFFTPMAIGTTTLAHRVVMAPLTRYRNTNNTPLPMAVEYYTQRSSVPGTLIVAEANQISPRWAGMPDGPGIWNEEQIQGWKKVTDAVHKREEVYQSVSVANDKI